MENTTREKGSGQVDTHIKVCVWRGGGWMGERERERERMLDIVRVEIQGMLQTPTYQQ